MLKNKLILFWAALFLHMAPVQISESSQISVRNSQEQEMINHLIAVLNWFSQRAQSDDRVKEQLQALFLQAATSGNHLRLHSLIACGIDVNTRGNFQDTALMRATYNNHKDTVIFLLQYGADTTLTDSFGFKAEDYAREYPEIMQVFETHKHIPYSLPNRS